MAPSDGFLSRWSRRKVAARQGEVLVEPPAASPVAAPVPAAPSVIAPQPVIEPTVAPGVAEVAPTLDDVVALETGAGVARFVAPGVARQVKNAALKKLFADPHFNVMDGLDVYIEDFGRPDPLPAGMLRAMLDSPSFRYLAPPQAQASPDAENQPEASHAAAPDLLTAPQPAAGLPPRPDGPDEDPDLRLQPFDAADAGPAGPGAPGPGGDAGRLA
jgi:hypothetical protein